MISLDDEYTLLNFHYIQVSKLEKMTKEEAKERKILSNEGMFYSMQRIDLLIISISGAGIYVCLEAIKYLTDKKIDISFLIKLSASFFLVAIFLNFLSQLSGFYSNKQDFLMCQAKIQEEEEKKIVSYDKKSDKYDTYTKYFNLSSIGFMFLGLIFIMIYFLVIF